METENRQEFCEFSCGKFVSSYVEIVSGIATSVSIDVCDQERGTQEAFRNSKKQYEALLAFVIETRAACTAKDVPTQPEQKLEAPIMKNRWKSVLRLFCCFK
ncbi:hypothetical protein IAQ61_004053 [Plenodomus lingam]|uniref:uncharacterized protein n=1 Tax=Leptosphaeria maculans TaxID=5022 RepID=UPI00331DAFA8|nr:hypothetical protein IAQ61_004053 [Plenodomus lingam]